MHSKYDALLSSRDVFIHPLEYVKTWNDSSIKLETLDLRSVDEFNKFHLNGAKNIELKQLSDSKFTTSFASLPAQGVVVIVANDESLAVKAWQHLKVQGVVNLYILEGGLVSWETLFSQNQVSHEVFDLTRPPIKILDSYPKDFYKSKIKLKLSKRSGGLCS